MENPLVPINEDINEIENNLFMGNLETACNSDLLKKYKIKRILSVLQTKIPEKYIIAGIEYKYINIWDMDNEDILSYFPDCCQFIQSGQEKGENIFLHCRAGRSRSATIVMAFIMKKYGYNMEYTIKTITVLRNEISPNPGFQNQLKLWQKMGFVLLGSNHEYRLVLVGGVKNRLLIINRFAQTEGWKTCSDAITAAFICYLQKVLNAENNCKSLDRRKAYMCKGCSNQLFEEIHIIRNTDTSNTCASVYVEPQKWILEEIVSNAKSMKDVINGEIKCFQCKTVLGTFDWHSSAQNCECEAHKGLKYYLAIKIDLNKLNQ